MTQIPDQEPTLREVLETIERFNQKIEKQEQEWSERFYQLSRDTLNFARNVIVTAAIVAVFAPLLRDSLMIALDLIQKK